MTSDRRYLRGLEGLNILARELVSDLRLDELTQRIVDEAKRILDARFSALIALRPGSDVEIQHFAYNAPRELFPARLPRVVGLLAVPIQTRSAARLDDIRGHPAGVGIPVEHPPLASLLAVPIIAGDEVIGELAVANAPGDASFDEVDESLLRELASHAAIAMTLAASRRDRERAEEDRAALLGLALHNIRTPITIARGFVSTVRGHAESLTEPVREEAFNAIDRALERIHTLAEGALLQDWRPPEAPVRKAPTNLDEIVSGLFSDLESLSRSVELRYLPDPTLPQRPSLDVLLVREILHNLMTNAIQHSPEGEAVVLSARLEGPSIRFDVTDSGPGIPARQQARLFVEPPPLTTPGASGADPSSSHPLWNVKRIVDRMGGNVGVSSRPGEGSTFWFTVPVETG